MVKNVVYFNHGYDEITVSRSVVFGKNFGNDELRAAWRGFHVGILGTPKEGTCVLRELR